MVQRCPVGFEDDVGDEVCAPLEQPVAQDGHRAEPGESRALRPLDDSFMMRDGRTLDRRTILIRLCSVYITLSG